MSSGDSLNLSPPSKRVPATLGAFAALALALAAQGPAAQGAPPPTFAAVSIRPSPPRRTRNSTAGARRCARASRAQGPAPN